MTESADSLARLLAKSRTHALPLGSAQPGQGDPAASEPRQPAPPRSAHKRRTRPTTSNHSPMRPVLLTVLVGALAGSACALTIVWCSAINRALALDLCRQEAKAAHLSADHCYQR
jgi:hypothetical protein